MRVLSRWAWLVVLGTALALSWWSLDALARRYGTPPVLAGMVSTTFDGAALVAAELAIRRAQAADSAGAVKLLMLAAVSLSAWLNYEHGALLHYPFPVRMLFAAPPVIAGSLFELQLRSVHRSRLRELGQVAEPLPRLGFMVWALHPLAALKRVHAITGSRLQSVPVTVMDWTGAGPPVPTAGTAPIYMHESPDPSVEGTANAALMPAPVESTLALPIADESRTHERAGRTAVPDELYLEKLRALVAENGGILPSARKVARLLSVGQDRARRLIALLAAEQSSSDTA